MRNKIICLLAASLMLSSAVTVRAAESGWTISYYGSNTDRSVYSLSVTADYKFSGDTALYIKYPGTEKNSANYAEARGRLTQALTEGSYTLTFYNKGAASAYTEISVGEDITIGYSDMTRERVQAADAPSGENGWYRYTYTFDCTSAEYIAFRWYGGTTSSAIDDISITAADDDTNRLADPGFDGVEDTDETEEEFDTTDYRPREMFASEGDGTVCLSWINPAAAELSGVSVYNITNGTRSKLTDAISAAPSQLVLYKASDLAAGTNLFEVVFEFAGKPSFSYYLSGGSQSTEYDVSYGGWNVHHYHMGEASYTPAKTLIDTEDAHGGEAALKLISHIDSELDPDIRGNNYIRLAHNVSFKSNRTYRIKMWAKSENAGAIAFNISWSHYNSIPISGTHDWAEYSWDIEFGDEEGTEFYIITESPGVYWLDDISITELDENGEPGEELVPDGDIEGLLSNDTGRISAAELTDITDTSMNISWETASAKVAWADLYIKQFGSYEWRGTVAADVNNILISDLKAGTEYSYLLVPINPEYTPGEPVELTAETAMPDHTITAPILKKGSTAVSRPMGAGSYTVTSEIKNYKIEDMAYTQLVGVYKDNALIKLYATEKTIEIRDRGLTAQKVNTRLELPDDGEYTIKVYIIDTSATQNILYPCTTFK